MPVVGITSASLAALEGVGGPHPESSVVGRRYVQAVLDAGGIPWPIPVVGDPAAVHAVYDRLDGLILTGGSDIRPQRYGAGSHPRIDGGDPERDEVELALAAWASRDGKPALGICRGMQMLNVSRGGTLLPHLPEAVGDAIKHDNYPLARYPRDLGAHDVAVAPGSRVVEALGSGALTVNSIHHQAVDRPGVGLVISARAPDGVVEVVEDPDHPFFIGVQWHPEELADHPSSQRLFSSLIAACRRWREGQAGAPTRPFLAAG